MVSEDIHEREAFGDNFMRETKQQIQDMSDLQKQKLMEWCINKVDAVDESTSPKDLGKYLQGSARYTTLIQSESGEEIVRRFMGQKKSSPVVFGLEIHLFISICSRTSSSGRVRKLEDDEGYQEFQRIREHANKIHSFETNWKNTMIRASNTDDMVKTKRMIDDLMEKEAEELKEAAEELHSEHQRANTKKEENLLFAMGVLFAKEFMYMLRKENNQMRDLGVNFSLVDELRKSDTLKQVIVVLWNNFLREGNVDITDETRSIVHEVFELENDSDESSSSKQDDSSKPEPTKEDIEESRDQIIRYIEKYEPFIEKAMRDSQKVTDDNLVERPEQCVNGIDRAIGEMEEFYSGFEQGEQEGDVDPAELKRLGKNEAKPRVEEAYYILFWLDGKKREYEGKLGDEDYNNNYIEGVYYYLATVENYCLSRFKRELAKYEKDDVLAARDLGYSLLIDAFNSERFEDYHKERLETLIGSELKTVMSRADAEMDWSS